MAGDTDFIALYQELGLDPDCTPEALRQAYRKRVAALHPDRRTGQAQSSGPLQRLNTQYAAAMEFQRRHGRLPGATQQSGIERPAPPPAGTPGPGNAPDPAGPGPARTRSRVPLATLLLVIGGLWAFARFVPADPELPVNPKPSTPASGQTGAARPDTTRAITLGTRAQEVRAIHGEPVSGWEKRWEYGPSWVAFECGVVTDWYSSPLRPLKVGTEHPPATTHWSPPKHCKE